MNNTPTPRMDSCQDFAEALGTGQQLERELQEALKHNQQLVLDSFPVTEDRVRWEELLQARDRLAKELAEAKEKTNDPECICCPECHCKDFTHANEIGKGYRVCAQCEQEWWTDINYGKIDLHLKPLRVDRDRWRKMAEELAAILEQGKNVVKDVLLPALNKKGPTELWLPEQIEFASFTANTDSALSRFNAMKGEKE